MLLFKGVSESCNLERVFWCQFGFIVVQAFTQRTLAPEFLILVFWKEFSGVSLVFLWPILTLKGTLFLSFCVLYLAKGFLVSAWFHCGPGF